MSSLRTGVGFFLLALPCLAKPPKPHEPLDMSEILPEIPSSIAGLSELNGVQKACYAFNKMYPGEVVYRKSDGYARSNRYFSVQQNEMHPFCYVRPKNAQEISTILTVLKHFTAPFTVKSGGGSSYTGSSNVEGGVNIDLIHLNGIIPSNKTKESYFTLGPAARWGDVYTEGEAIGMSCHGSRAEDSTVGGYLLGGGLGYHGQKYGFSGDNVRLFEVVTASGEIVEATKKKNKDLYWALRGGAGPNFGIVTRFDLDTFPMNQMWVNKLVYNATDPKDYKYQIREFTNYAFNDLITNPNITSLWVSRPSPSPQQGFVTEIYSYHPDRAPYERPESSFTVGLPAGAQLNVTGMTYPSNHSKEWNEPYGWRRSVWTTTISSLSMPLMEDIMDLWYTHVAKLTETAKGTPYEPKLMIHPINFNFFKATEKNRGSARALPHTFDLWYIDPLYILEVYSSWEEPSLDGVIENMCTKFIFDVELLAQHKGLRRHFKHMNNADKSQNYMVGLVEKTRHRLLKVAMKWDPDGDLHRLWQGYHKHPRYDLIAKGRS